MEAKDNSNEEQRADLGPQPQTTSGTKSALASVWKWGLQRLLRVEVWKMLAAVASVIICLLYWSGVIFGPKISVACGAADLRIPAKFKMQIFMLKFMSLSETQMQHSISNSLRLNLRDGGMSEGRTAELFAKANLLADGGDQPATNASLHLLPHENVLVKAAVAKALSDYPALMLNSVFPNTPDGVLFFDIRNDGLRAAKDAHLVIRVGGTVYETLFDSDNAYVEQKGSANQKVLDFPSISPGSRTRGFVWYCHVGERQSVFTNEVCVAFDTGTVRRSFSENDFGLTTP